MFPGKLMEVIRRNKGMSREALAKNSGTNESTISRYELEATANPTWEILIKICVALDITPDVFFEAAMKGEEEGLAMASTRTYMERLITLAEVQTKLLEGISERIGGR